MNEQKKSIAADSAMLLVAVIWGGGFIAVKDALNSIEPFEMMIMRFLIAAIVMSLIFWKKIIKINKNDIIAGTVIGIFMFLGFAFQTIGLKYTTAGKQAFLTGTYVVLVPFLEFVVMKKKVDLFSVIGAFMAFLGIGLLTLQNGLSIGLGDALTLICAVFFAAQIIAVDHFTAKYSPIALTIIQLFVGAFLSAVFSAVFREKAVHFNPNSVTAIIYLALFSTMLAFIIQNVAQKYTASTHAAILMSLESFFGCIFSVILLGEGLSTKMIIGCAIIFLAIITVETKWKFFKTSS